MSSSVPRLAVLLPLAALGCASEPGPGDDLAQGGGHDPADTGEAPSFPLPGDLASSEPVGEPVVEDPDTGEPFTGEAAAAAFEDAFAEGFPAPRGMWATVADMIDEGDAECPGEDYQLDGALEGCTSDSGYSYVGVLEVYFDEVDETAEGGNELHELRLTNGNFVITPPEGAPYRNAATYTHRWERGFDGYVFASLQHLGTYQYSDSEHAWLREGLSMTSTISGSSNASGDSIRLSTSFGWGMHAVRFDGVTWSSSICEHAPHDGILQVRRADGSWASTEFTEDCEPCTSWVDLQGNDLGESCHDFGPTFEMIHAEAVAEP